jgi:co-chaperonin GroES (HSP10)
MTGNVDAGETGKPTTPIIDWKPAPGFLLCKALKREEVAALYGRGTAGKLGLPDKVGKVSDSVGVGQIIEMGGMAIADMKLQYEYNELLKKGNPKTVILPHPFWKLKVGDYIAWMPYTDQIIEIDGQKYSLVGYEKIRAAREGNQ